MSKFNSIVFGKMTGSIGNATTAIWRGINVAREKPTTVANPRSAGQVKQRVLFSALVAMSRIFNVIFNIGFAKAAIKMTPYNVFVSLNQFSEFVTNPSGTPVYDLTKLKLAKGSANPITELYVEEDGDTTIVRVDAVSGSLPPAGSTLYIAIITQTGSAAPVLRAFEEVAFTTTDVEILSPTSLTGTTRYACAFYVNGSTLQPCDSIIEVPA